MPDRLRKVLHAFSALADLGEEISENSDFDEMVSSALHVVRGALGVRRGAVGEYDREAGLLRLVASRGTEGALSEGVSLSPELFTGANGAATKTSRDLSQIEDLIKARVEALSPEFVTALVVRGELVGAIILGA